MKPHRLLIIGLLLRSGLALAEPATAPTSGQWGLLPVELASVLEVKSRAYVERATSFVCIESVRDAEYSGHEARDERVRDFEYTLVRDRSVPEGLRALRIKPGTAGPNADEERLELPFPEPYYWSQIFQPNIRSTFRFQVGEWHTTPYKLAIPIAWVSSAPVEAGRRVTEWSGTAEVEWRTGNMVRVIARPSLQDERLLAQLQRYLTAFRFLGVSTATAPIGQELTVDFGYDRDGFSYPQRVELSTFQQMGRERREVLRRQVVEYRDYRFFTTETTEEVPPLTYATPASGQEESVKQP